MQSDHFGLVHALIGLVTWFSVIAAFQFILLPTLVDRFRQRIFLLRRQMFLLLLDTPLQPDEPAYTHLRSTMNGILRFAERLTLTRLLLHSISFREQTKAYSKKLQVELAQVENQNARNQLAMFRSQLGQEIIRHAVMISPLSWAFFILSSPVLFFLFFFQGLQSLLVLGRKGVTVLAKHLSVQGIEAQAEALVIRS